MPSPRHPLPPAADILAKVDRPIWRPFSTVELARLLGISPNLLGQWGGSEAKARPGSRARSWPGRGTATTTVVPRPWPGSTPGMATQARPSSGAVRG